MHNRTIAIVTRSLLSAAEKYGAKIPTPTLKILRGQLELAEQVAAYNPASPDLSTAVVDALARDVDPLSDPAVLRAHLTKYIHEARGGFVESTNQKIYDALLAEWPAIMAAFKIPFDQAGRTLTETYKDLTKAGYSELTDTAPQNETLAVSWVRGHSARRTIDDLLGILGSPAVIFGWSRYMNDMRRYDTNGVLADMRSNTDPWTALDNGWAISLATPDIYAERVAAGERNRSAQQRARDDQEKRQLGKHDKRDTEWLASTLNRS